MYPDEELDSRTLKIEPVSILVPEYEAFLLNRGVKNQDLRGYKHFHPSAFGGCKRKMVLQYFGEIKPELKEPRIIEARSERIFAAGHAHHYRMQREFADMGILRGWWRSMLTGKVYGKKEKLGIFRPETLEEIGEERPFGDDRSIGDILVYEEIQVENEEYNFKGHVDGIVELERGNPATRYVVDFKTSKQEKFQFIKTASRKPDPVYVTQINIYMWLLDIDQGIIFYEEKNTHECLEFLVPKDRFLIEDIKKDALGILDFIKHKKIPKVKSNYNKTKYPCAYCGYKDFCFKEK